MKILWSYSSFNSGKYCEKNELSNYTGLCNPGYYCIQGAKLKEPIDNVTGNICPQGKYCPIGSSAPISCPYGTFSTSTGNKGVDDCLPCTSGWYCGSQGLIEPSGKCSEGFYCPGGQNSSRPYEHRLDYLFLLMLKLNFTLVIVYFLPRIDPKIFMFKFY